MSTWTQTHFLVENFIQSFIDFEIISQKIGYIIWIINLQTACHLLCGSTTWWFGPFYSNPIITGKTSCIRTLVDVFPGILPRLGAEFPLFPAVPGGHFDNSGACAALGLGNEFWEITAYTVDHHSALRTLAISNLPLQPVLYISPHICVIFGSCCI